MSDPAAVRRALRALFSPLGCPDPYPHYAVLREHGPVSRLPDGTVVVSRHADCDRVLRDPLFRVEDDAYLARTWPEGRDHLSVFSLMGEMVNQNSPHHERLRRLVGRAFTPRRVAGLRPAVEKLVDGLLDGLAERAAGGAPVDLMEHFALPLPITVIGELLGIPEEDRAWFAPRVQAVTSAIEQNLAGEALERADEATAELWDRLGALAARRQEDPRADLVSTLIAVREEDGDRLTRRELLANLVLLYSAGYETTSNLIGNGTAVLLDRPDLLARLRGEPERIDAWVEEMLRFDPPIQIASRWAGRTPSWAGWPWRRAPKWWPCSPAPTAILRATGTRTSSGRTGRRAARSPSARARTTAWAPHWPAWRRPSPSPAAGPLPLDRARGHRGAAQPYDVPARLRRAAPAPVVNGSRPETRHRRTGSVLARTAVERGPRGAAPRRTWPSSRAARSCTTTTRSCR